MSNQRLDTQVRLFNELMTMKQSLGTGLTDSTERNELLSLLDSVTSKITSLNESKFTTASERLRRK